MAQAERWSRLPGLRWHHLYYVLASFDLLAVVLGLYLGQEALAIYTRSVEINQRWAMQTEEFSDLNWLVDAVNRPGNDVFESKNVPAERAHLHEALYGFHDRLKVLRRNMREHFAGSDLVRLHAVLGGVEAATDEMAVQAEHIFADVSAGRPAEAGRRMAAMDRRHAEIRGELSSLRTVVRGIQQENFSRQLAAAERLETIKYALGACLLAMVLGVVAYGRRLTREAQRETAVREAAAAAAQRFQQQQREILDAVPAKIFYKDRDNHILWCNRPAADLVGLPVAQIVGASAEDLFPRQAATFHADDLEVIRSGAPKLGIIHPVQSAKGDRWMRTDKIPHRNERGEIVGVIVFATDITSEREANNRQRLTAFALDHSTDGIITVDAAGRICTANRTFCLLHGYTAEEAMRLSVRDINPQSTPDTWARHWDDLLRSGQETFEAVHRRKDGSSFPVEVSVGLLQAGAAHLCCSIIRDITERKQAELSLREGAARLTRQQQAILGLIQAQGRGAGDRLETVRLVTHTAAAVLSVQRVSLWRMAGDGLTLRCEDLYELSEDRHSSGHELAGHTYPAYFAALAESRLIAADDAHRDPRTSEFSAGYLTSLGITSMLDVPLHKQGKLDGVFCCEQVGPARSWTLDEQSFVLALANLVELADERSDRQRAEDQFKQVVESSPVGKLVIDQAGHIVLANAQIERQFGYDRAELLGQPIERLIPERYHGSHPGMRGGFFAAPSTRAMGMGRDLYGLRKDGTEVPVEIGLTPIEMQAGTYVLASVLDITERKRAEEALAGTTAALEYALEGISRLDSQGRYRSVNAAYAACVGYAPEEMIGMSWEATVHPDDLALVQEAYRRMLAEGKGEAEARGVRKDGTHFFKQVVMVKAEPWQGQGSGYFCFMKDISERKRAEEQLRQSVSFISSVVDNLPTMVFVKDAKDLRFVRFNKAGEHLTGYPERTLLGKNDYDFFPKEQADAFVAKDRAVLEGRQMTDVPEEPIQTKDRGLRYLHTKKIPLYDAAGVPQYLVGVSEDITEHKRTEEVVKEQMRLSIMAAEVNRALAMSMALPAMLRDCVEALVRNVDAAFARIWLLGPGDLCASCHKEAHCADRDRCLHLTASAGLYTGLNGEYRRIPLGSLKIGTIALGGDAMVTNDVMGDERLPNKAWMKENGLQSFAGYPLHVGDRVVGVLALFARRPLSPSAVAALDSVSRAVALGIERKRAEEALTDRSSQLEAANKELEAFSYSVSHDLRAPLRHIDGFAELLRGRAADRLDEKSGAYLRAISDSAVRMGRLIEDLLAFSRLGRADVRRQLVALDDLIRSVREELEPETKGRTIVWTVGALPKVPGDPALLRQVWANLMGNAVKYTAKRERATIEIGCTSGPGDRETVVFIRDNGAGFDMTYAEKLFGVFQRLHGADEFEGTGIGLANVRRIVARHGGRVWAEGVVGKGATFYVALPA